MKHHIKPSTNNKQDAGQKKKNGKPRRSLYPTKLSWCMGIITLSQTPLQAWKSIRRSLIQYK